MIKSCSMAVLLVALSAASAQGGAGHIVVNMGDYASAQQAATDEANVGWDDGKDADDVICTECFAAVELQRCLRKMTGDGARFDVVDDDKAPADGALILLGNPKTNKQVAACAMKLGLNDAAFAVGAGGGAVGAGWGDTGGAFRERAVAFLRGVRTGYRSAHSGDDRAVGIHP